MKYLLVQMALQSSAEFFERFKPGSDTQYLPDLWTALGLELEEAERVPNTGASTWHRPQACTVETLVLILPEPQATNEAYFIGARSAANAWRGFLPEVFAFAIYQGETNGTDGIRDRRMPELGQRLAASGDRLRSTHG